jgi:hypothetical protein
VQSNYSNEVNGEFFSSIIVGGNDLALNIQVNPRYKKEVLIKFLKSYS